MIDRKDEILKVGQDLLQEHFLLNEKEIFLKYNNKKENILKELNLKIQNFINKNFKIEKYSNKIKYISITFLYSSIITKSYDFVFGLYDENFYVNENTKLLYLNIDFIFNYFEDDIKFFEKNSKIIQLQTYELYYLKELHIKNYYKIAFKIFKDVIRNILKENILNDLLEKNYKIVFCQYMGEFSEIEMENEL